MMTLDMAHSMAVIGDRKITIRGEISGKWYEDHILDYLSEHRDDEVEVVHEDTDEIVVIKK